MIHRLLIIGLFMVFLWPAGAMAQQCDTIEQSMADLMDPKFGASSLWSSGYGDKNLTDHFSGAAVFPETGDVVFAGQRFWKDGEDVSLTLVKMGRNGRVIWNKIYSNLKLSGVVKIISAGKEFIVLGGRPDTKTKRPAMWIGVFNEAGDLLRQKTLADPKLSLVARDIVFLAGQKEIMLVGGTVPKDEKGAFYSVFYRLDLNLKQRDKKALNIGLNNAINALELTQSGTILATGHIITRDGRKAGWIVSLDQRGIINWQREYARGAEAHFNAVRSYQNEYAVMAGWSKPYYLQDSEVKNTGAWVMAVNQSNGDRLWERFYTEKDFDLTGHDVHIYEDGLVSAVMNAQRTKAPEESKAATDIETAKGFVRIVSFNRRGVVLESNGYFGAEDVEAHGMLVGKAGERILYGRSRIPYNVQDRAVVASQAWANAADSLAPYTDPCVRQ